MLNYFSVSPTRCEVSKGKELCFTFSTPGVGSSIKEMLSNRAVDEREHGEAERRSWQLTQFTVPF